MEEVKRFLLCLLILAMAAGFTGFSENEARGTVVVVEEPLETDGLALNGLKIGIDPGHQMRANTEKEPVAPGSAETKAKVAAGTRGVRTGRPEYAVNLEVSLLLRDALEALGAEVLMTRETNEADISNVERAVMMNEWGADFVVRIHCNGSNVSSANGMGMYVRKTGACAAESERLARALLDAMGRETGANRQGVFQRDTYTGLNWSEVPCVLVEMGYMTNPDEDERLSDPEYQEKLVRGMAAGMIAYAQSADSPR